MPDILLVMGIICLIMPITFAFVEFSIWLEYEKDIDVGVLFTLILSAVGIGFIVTWLILR